MFKESSNRVRRLQKAVVPAIPAPNLRSSSARLPTTPKWPYRWTVVCGREPMSPMEEPPHSETDDSPQKRHP